MKRGINGISLIIALVIGAMILILVFTPLGKTVTNWLGYYECDYCAPQCGVLENGIIVGSETIGSEYCENYDWEIGHLTQAVKNKYFGGTTGDTISGESLQCCALIPGATAPASYLTSEYRGEERDPAGTAAAAAARPTVRAYFAEQAYPLRNGEIVEIVSGFEKDFIIEVSNVKSVEGEVFKTIKEKPDDLYCTFRLYDKLENNILEDASIFGVKEGGPITFDCSSFSEEGGRFFWTTVVNIPSQFDGQNLRFELALSESETGRINPEGSDVLFRNTFQVINPVQFSNYGNNWVKEQTLSVSCKGITCSNFYWTTLTATATCGPELFTDEKQETRYSGQGRGFFTIGPAQVTNENKGIVNVCVEGITAGKAYYKQTPLPVKVDNIPPRVDADYNFFNLWTNVTCESDSQSGCANAVGYHYISYAVDFIGALFSGVSDTKWCPTDENQYRFIPAQRMGPPDTNGNYATSAIIPFTSQQDFMVMCVVAKDNAGNVNKDIVIVYNVWEALAAVADDQTRNGGIGSGYFGYGFGR